MTALDHVHLLSPEAQVEYYLERAAHYQKLANEASVGIHREALEAVARDFTARANAVKAKD